MGYSRKKSTPPRWKPCLKTSQEGINDSRNPDWGQWGSEPNTSSWPRGFTFIIAWITGTFSNEPCDANVAFCPKRKTRANSEMREKGKKILTEGGDVKRTSENTIHYLKIVTFLATRNTDSSINPWKCRLYKCRGMNRLQTMYLIRKLSSFWLQKHQQQYKPQKISNIIINATGNESPSKNV